MIQPLSRFWPSLERVPDMALTIGGWSGLLGDEHAVMARFLLPTQRIAKSLSSTEPHRHCIHEIRPWKRQYLSVCPDGCDPITLTREQVTIHELDVVRLAKELASLLCLEAVAAERLTSPTGLWRIGDYVPLAGYRFPVYLTFTGEPDVLLRAAENLVARATPFILAIPSRSALTQGTRDVIQNAKASFISLSECVGYDAGKLRLRSEHSLKSLFADLCAMHLPKPEESNGIVPFPTPSGAKWKDVTFRFIDRHSVYITVQSESGKFHCAQMGMASKKNAKPTLQWLLLEIFAEGDGLLDWRNRKADRKNQKRKENLARDLQRFFRIDGDPFVLEGSGWRAKFGISVQ